MKSKLGVSVQMQCTLSGLILNPRRHRGSAFGDLRARPFASGLSSSVAMVGTCPPPTAVRTGHGNCQNSKRKNWVGCRGKSGPALGGTEYRLMPSACRLIVRAKL